MTKDILAAAIYESPKVEVLEVEVEKGFAGSNDPTGTIDPWGQSK